MKFGSSIAITYIIKHQHQLYFFYWYKYFLGNISDEELLYILRGLATNLGIAKTESIISLAEINAKINRFLLGIYFTH